MMGYAKSLQALQDGELESYDLADIPYARFLGLKVTKAEDSLMVVMPYQDMLIGAPHPPRLHGGVVGAALEIAGAVAVGVARRDENDLTLEELVKPIGITIEYMRGGAPEDVYAQGDVLRLGRRVANVRALAWQGDKSKPIAAATMNFMMN